VSGLLLNNVSKDFSGVRAVHGVTLLLPPGQIVGLVGPNGSGKTTVVNLATGTLPPSSGTVQVDDADLTGSSSARFAAAGVLRTFQALRLFEGLSALENVMVGAQRRCRTSLSGSLIRSPGFRRRERRLRSESMAALGQTGVAHLADHPVASLSHGQRRAVELARAMAARPDYLVLDEPAAGVDPGHVVALGEAVRAIRSAGAGVLLVEHDVELIEALADEVIGMAEGHVVAQGSFALVAAAPQLAAHLARR